MKIDRLGVHFRNGLYELNNIICDTPDAESHKDETAESIQAEAVNFAKMPQRFMGEYL